MASNLREILRDAVSGTSPVLNDFLESFPDPAAIAARCGSQETADLISMLQGAAEARDRVDPADGDEQDSYWRAMRRLSGVLDLLAPTFPEQLIRGLSSAHPATRCYVAIAMGRSRLPAFAPALRTCLESETDTFTIKVLGDALSSCITPQLGASSQPLGRLGALLAALTPRKKPHEQ